MLWYQNGFKLLVVSLFNLLLVWDKNKVSKDMEVDINLVSIATEPLLLAATYLVIINQPIKKYYSYRLECYPREIIGY